VSHIYKTLDHAAMVAADEIYSRSKGEQWEKEFGMLIFGNDGENEFILSKYKVQESNDPQIVFHQADLETRYYKGSKYYIKAVIHSHPTKRSIEHNYGLLIGNYFQYNNELSIGDYDEYFIRKSPIIMYLVTDVGERGTLIRFKPPSDVFYGRNQFKKAAEALGVGEPAYLPRDTMVAVVSKIVNNGGELLEKPIGFDAGVEWAVLSPEAMLWKSCASTVHVGLYRDSEEPDQEKNGIFLKNDNCAENNRYNGRVSMYDLRETVTKVIYKEGVRVIGAFAFKGFTNLQELTISSSVNQIQKGAFAGCTKLKKITIRGEKPPQIINRFQRSGSLFSETTTPNVFQGLSSDARIYVPASVIHKYRWEDGWRDLWQSNFLSIP
jgi:hypothetical protein